MYFFMVFYIKKGGKKKKKNKVIVCFSEMAQGYDKIAGSRYDEARNGLLFS